MSSNAPAALKRRWNAVRRKTGYRSSLEVSLAKQLQGEGINFKYESVTIPYTLPAVVRHYTPDFPIPGTNILIEGKGRWDADDRKKMLLVREQNPQWDIRIIFENARGRIYPGSKTTNAEWADKHGITWAHKTVPPQWIVDIQTALTKENL